MSTNVQVALPLDEYVVLDQRVDLAEHDGIWARWEFGRRLLAERVGKQLPRGRLDEVADATGKSRRELGYRMKFAEAFSSEDEVCNALQTFRSWRDITETLTEAKGTQSGQHPARYSGDLLEEFAKHLQGYHRVLDPFAGTGRIHELADAGWDTVGIEIEPEWATLHERTQVGNALELPFGDGEFDAICTSPTYGNRMADHHEATDANLRRSYRHDLGRELSPANSGQLQWGPEYREFHQEAWKEALRVLRPGGRFILNIKDHIRQHEPQAVTGWHLTFLTRLGLSVTWLVPVELRGMGQGQNRDVRFGYEWVLVLDQ